MVIILSGPSGVGKDTVLERWMAQNPRLRKVTAFTSRTPREGEENGRDYHFVSEAEFLRKAEAGDFLEWKLVHGNYYATPFEGLNQLLDAGFIPILKIDVQGALDVMGKRDDLVSIMLLPPSMEELERRIRVRNSDKPGEIETRLANAIQELDFASRYQYRVVNGSLALCLEELEAIVSGT